MVDGDLLQLLKIFLQDVLAIRVEMDEVLDPRVLNQRFVFNKEVELFGCQTAWGAQQRQYLCPECILWGLRKEFLQTAVRYPTVILEVLALVPAKWLALPSKSGGKPAICQASITEIERRRWDLLALGNNLA